MEGSLGMEDLYYSLLFPPLAVGCWALARCARIGLRGGRSAPLDPRSALWIIAVFSAVFAGFSAFSSCIWACLLV